VRTADKSPFSKGVHHWVNANQRREGGSVSRNNHRIHSKIRHKMNIEKSGKLQGAYSAGRGRARKRSADVLSGERETIVPASPPTKRPRKQRRVDGAPRPRRLLSNTTTTGTAAVIGAHHLPRTTLLLRRFGRDSKMARIDKTLAVVILAVMGIVKTGGLSLASGKVPISVPSLSNHATGTQRSHGRAPQQRPVHGLLPKVQESPSCTFTDGGEAHPGYDPCDPDCFGRSGNGGNDDDKDGDDYRVRPFGQIRTDVTAPAPLDAERSAHDIVPRQLPSATPVNGVDRNVAALASHSRVAPASDIADNSTAAVRERARARAQQRSKIVVPPAVQEQHQQQQQMPWFEDSSVHGPPCTYNKYLSIMNAVSMLSVRQKRDLFKKMREGKMATEPHQAVNRHTLLPHLGITFGEFSFFYVLTSKNES